MATGSGLDAQIGFGQETVWGTGVTPTRFLEFNNETLSLNPTWLEPTGLRVGTVYKRAPRARVSRSDISGDFEVEHATKGMGPLWKNALASTITVPTQIGTTTAYKQIHTPGGHRGLGMTVQVGRPEPATGTVRPFTYAGCKVTQWDFDLKDNAVPTLKLTLDGKSEDTTTALTTASFLTGATVFDFSQSQILLGGSASTASGETTVASGVLVSTILKEFSLTGKSPMDNARFGIGNAGLKAEQLENATPDITGKLTAEFGKVEFYDLFKTFGSVSLQFVLTGGAIGASGSNFLLSFVMPAVKLKDANPQVSGPAVVSMATTFEVYSDEVNPVFQTKIVSDETTL